MPTAAALLLLPGLAIVISVPCCATSAATSVHAATEVAAEALLLPSSATNAHGSADELELTPLVSGALLLPLHGEDAKHFASTRGGSSTTTFDEYRASSSMHRRMATSVTQCESQRSKRSSVRAMVRWYSLAECLLAVGVGGDQ